MKRIELKPIRETKKEYDHVEKRILAIFKSNFFFPMLKILDKKSNTLKNALGDSLEEALQSGRLTYIDGHFVGKLNANISLKLKQLGAVWDKKTKSFKLPFEKLPMNLRVSLVIQQQKQEEKLKELDQFLSRLDTKEFSEKIKVADLFDENLFKLEKDFQQSIKDITVAPVLPEVQRERISVEWQQNMQLDIKKFTDAQVVKLRELVEENMFGKGERREVLHASIEKMLLSINADWPHVQSKAKFLAHQETNLLTAKYKQTRYEAAGVTKYKWACVHMPHQSTPKAPYVKGDVRYGHGILEGKIFSWDNPPITTNPTAKKQQRNNPGQDYNCRCYPIPIVEFNE